jgi:hypothetical protein
MNLSSFPFFFLLRFLYTDEAESKRDEIKERVESREREIQGERKSKRD